MIRSVANGHERSVSETQPDGWPRIDEPTLVNTPAPSPPPPVPPPGDRQIGAGMLLGIGAIGLVAIGLLLALLVTRRSDPQTGTTVIVTNPGTAPASTAGSTAPTPQPAQVTVPNFVGSSLSDAKARLKTLGLGVAVTSAASDKPAGTIVDQAPKGGQTVQKKDGLVTLSVARTTSTTSTTTTSSTTTTTAAPTTATMPDVSGQSEQAAATSLNQAGVLASLFFVPASDELGTVEQQAKPAGTNLPYHSHVQLNISRGPGQKTDETVPNVIGRSLTDAVSTLNAAQLRLIYVKYAVTSAGQAGKIVQQSPLAGGKAPQNAQVLVFVGVRPS
jgi:eukaryotic-like serine/threonine-protein kinase